MATKEAQLKIRSGDAWDVINPKTTITAITGLSSTLSSINADLLNSGAVGTSATPATGDYLLISDANASTAHAVRKGIQINTAGTRFLKESGVWADVVTNNSAYNHLDLGTPSPGSSIETMYNACSTAGFVTNGVATVMNTSYFGLFIINKLGTKYNFRLIEPTAIYEGTDVSAGTNYAALRSDIYRDFSANTITTNSIKIGNGEVEMVYDSESDSVKFIWN